MAMNRWVKSAWSFDGGDDEDEKVRFLMSTPEKYRPDLNEGNEDVRRAKSKNKLIELLGAEYLSLLNELNQENRPHKIRTNASKNIRVGPTSKDSGLKDSIVEESEDDTIDPDEDLNNFRRYHQMQHSPRPSRQSLGVDNWGEDTCNDLHARMKRKRRSSSPIITISPR